ncbi:hypothetical protein ACHAWF_007690 [Thalassiosira exigua]
MNGRVRFGLRTAMLALAASIAYIAYGIFNAEVPSPSSASTLSGWVPTDKWLVHCVEDMKEHHADQVKPFATEQKWIKYSLGDCIKKCSCPDSNQNTSMAKELVNLPVPNENELVIHLRLGDVIELSDNTTDQMLTKGGDPRHHKNYKHSIKSVYEILSNTKESGMKRVSVVGGSHMPWHYNKSKVYASCVKRSIEKSGYEVTLRLDGTPDEDFYYMCHAKKFVATVGGIFQNNWEYCGMEGGYCYWEDILRISNNRISRITQNIKRIINEERTMTKLVLRPNSEGFESPPALAYHGLMSTDVDQIHKLDSYASHLD